MKNILNIDLETAPYSLGYTNEGGEDNIISLEFLINEVVTDPLIEITKVDGIVETFNIDSDIPFAIFQTPGIVKARFISEEVNSEYVNITISEEIGLYDNAVVKIVNDEFIVRKVKGASTQEAYDFITMEDIESLFS